MGIRVQEIKVELAVKQRQMLALTVYINQTASDLLEQCSGDCLAVYPDDAASLPPQLKVYYQCFFINLQPLRTRASLSP